VVLASVSPVWHPGFSGGCQGFGKICVHLTQMKDVWKKFGLKSKQWKVKTQDT
jgi:hypothetical protein